MTLTLFLEELCQEHIIYYLRKESHIWYLDASLDGDMSHTNFGSL